MTNPQISNDAIYGSAEDLSGPQASKKAMLRYMLARSKATWKHFGAQWLSNTRANIPQILKSTSHRLVLDIVKRTPKELVKAEQIFMFAAGPSLRRIENQVHELKGKGIIVATPTVLPWMRHHGLEPDWLLATDSNPSSIVPIAIDGARDIRLLCPSTIDRRLVELFPLKNVYWYNSLSQGPDGTIHSSEFSNFMQLLFTSREEEDYKIPGIDAWVVQAGCCTNQAVILLNWMLNSKVLDAKRIILMGADYCYWRGLSRVPFYQPLEKDILGAVPFYDPGTEFREPELYRPIGHPKDAIEWDGMQSNRRMVLYKRSLLLYYGATAAPLLSCSQGILTEIPYVSIEDILSGNYPRVLSPEEIAVACSGFLDEEFPNWFPLGIAA